MASVEELIVKLTANNTDLKAKLNESEKQVGGFGNSLKGIGALAGIGFAAAGVAALAFGRHAFKLAEQQDQANKRLLFALKGNTTAYKDLTDQAEKLRAATGVDDAAIMQIQQLGANAGYSTDKIKKVTEAAVELAAVTGQDLQAAYMQINATYNGTAGRLTRLDAEFGTLTEKQLKNGDAVDLILQKYKGFAENSATETQKLTSNWEEFTERLGGYTLPLVNRFFSVLNTNLKMAGDNSLTFWQKLTLPPDVYNDIMRQKAAFDNLGISVGRAIKENSGFTAGLAMVNALLKANEGKIATIIPKKATDGVKDSTSALEKWITTMNEASRKAQEMAQFDVPNQTAAGKIAGGLFGAVSKVNIVKPTAPGINAPADDQTKLRNAAIETNKKLQDQADIVISLADAFSEMASRGQIDMKSLVMTTLEGIRKIIQAKLAEAIASQIANGSSKGLPGLVLAAVGIAGVMALFSKMPAFAQGGIVGGGSYSGDNITARVNSGEMILNGNQQRELFAMANGMGGRNQVEVVGYISGDVIRLANKRGEYMHNRRG